MTQQERAVKLGHEKQFKRYQPPMPKGREAKVTRDKHFGSVYGKSTRPDNPPRVKGDASGRKIAVKAEGTRSWGRDPDWGGDKNGQAGVPSAINRQSLAMEQAIERKLPQWRKERRKIRAKGPVPFIIRPGHEQAPIKLPGMKAPEVTPKYVNVPTYDEKLAHAKVTSTWGTFTDKTLHTFRSKWR